MRESKITSKKNNHVRILFLSGSTPKPNQFIDGCYGAGAGGGGGGANGTGT
jgi:hypothetical protein